MCLPEGWECMQEKSSSYWPGGDRIPRGIQSRKRVCAEDSIKWMSVKLAADNWKQSIQIWERLNSSTWASKNEGNCEQKTRDLSKRERSTPCNAKGEVPSAQGKFGLGGELWPFKHASSDRVLLDSKRESMDHDLLLVSKRSSSSTSS